MNILPYKLSTTNDLLTSRAGLIIIAQLMQSIGFTDLVDQYFPAPGSNRGFKPSVFVNSMMLMLHEGWQRNERRINLPISSQHGIKQTCLYCYCATPKN